jgi:predicted AlkP superfamily phosphohydrolase/phosphomutase
VSPARVLIVGFDAADPDILLAMAAQGRLPTVAALLEQGTRAEVRNPVGLYVGALWSSFSTALTPGRHGRHAPRQLVPGTYEVHRSTPSDVHGQPFWAALAAAGRKVAVVDVPHSAPVDGHGAVQVVEWGAHDPALGLATLPASLAADITARFGDHPVHGPGRDCDRARGAEELIGLRDELLAAATTKGEISRHLLALDDWDLFVTVFSESHCAVHQCWHLRDASHPLHDPVIAERTGDVMEQVYVAQDEALGGLLDDAGDDVTVLLLASHGSKAHYDASFLLDRVLRRIEMADMGPEERMQRIVDERLWLRQTDDERWHHPRARDRVWRGFEELMPLDPALRPCFKVDNNEPYGGIRVNLVGREPDGQVAPSELDEFCRRLTADLLDIVNVDTGRPLARCVLRTAELYEGDQLDRLPDLLVEWDWSAPVRSISSPKIGRVDGEYTFTRTGDHRPDGLLVVRGPGVGPGELPAVQVTDVGPTVAAHFGCALPDVDGRPIEPLVGAAAETR